MNGDQTLDHCLEPLRCAQAVLQGINFAALFAEKPCTTKSQEGGGTSARTEREGIHFEVRVYAATWRCVSGPTPRNHNLSGRSVSGALLHFETKEPKKPRFRSLSLGVDDAARRPLFCIDIVVVNIRSNA
jgi:hypothetical protein